MARFDATFDAAGVEPMKAFEVLPAGKYTVQIVESDMRLTKDGAGQYLWLMLDILEGPLQGRKLFDQLNLVNANITTVEIAQRSLSAICHATGQMQVTDSEQLHLIPMTIQVSVEPPKNGYGERNRIRYMMPEAAASKAPAAPATSARPTAGPTAGPSPTPRPQRPTAPSAPPRQSAPWNRPS
ncbi:MAG: DUF669 domain-containing protein [Beijerinckiaceae bacterium]|nr:DUF669 domain-containing protein [Beijerinckiaceae bacterium]